MVIVTLLDLGRFAVSLMASPAVTGVVIPIDRGRHLDNAA